MKRISISTAIPYVNAAPHIGHALEYVQTDCYARFQRLIGNEIFFVTGSDENSLKNVQAAEKANLEILNFCGKNANRFADFKNLLNISFDIFWRTTNENHFIGSQNFWKLCQKDIYKKKYRGIYCVGCEAFFTEDELVDGLCPEHKTSPQIIEEENYFFNLKRYEQQIKSIITNDEIKIFPQERKNEVLSFINRGLEDFSISRSTARAHGWGVPVPDDPSQIMYVWFDALLTYINALGFYNQNKTYQQFWQKADERIHVLGKGITRFHAVYWVGMLLSAGLPLPTREFIHGYLTINREKISKTLGNVISPKDVVNRFGTDAFRYYLLREIPSFADGDFSYSRFYELYNSDLANNLGNLVSRVAKISLNNKYHYQEDCVQKFYPEVIKEIEEFRFDVALRIIQTHITSLNKQLDENTPWKMSLHQIQLFLPKISSEILRLAFNLAPFMPETALKIRSVFLTNNYEVLPLFQRLKPTNF